MTADNMLKGLLKNEKELFLATLGSFTLVDIGTIESINDKGRAIVLSNQYVANQRVIYQNVEVVYPGNIRGAYSADCSGSACLILFPYSCMPDTSTRMIRPGNTPYHKDGVKVIPIGNGSQSTVKQFINTAGEYSISTKVYTLSFDKETVSLSQGDVLSIAKDAEGNIYLRHKGENSGVCLFSLDGEGLHKSYSSLNGDVVWDDTITTEGVRTFVQKDNQGNTMSSVTIAANGTITVQSAKDVVVNTDGDIKMNGDSKHLVKYEELNQAMTKLYTALTTTPIVGNGSPQATWAGLNPVTGIDISGSKADTLLTK